MTLAVMYAHYHDELVCDMAETYHVFDLRALPVETLATLAVGLRENSRVKMKMAGIRYIPMEVVLSEFFDTYIIRNTPGEKRGSLKLLSDALMNKGDQAARKNMAFRSGEDFMRVHAALFNGVENNG